MCTGIEQWRAAFFGVSITKRLKKVPRDPKGPSKGKGFIFKQLLSSGPQSKLFPSPPLDSGINFDSSVQNSPRDR